jgi:hypothetical protein
MEERKRNRQDDRERDVYRSSKEVHGQNYPGVRPIAKDLEIQMQWVDTFLRG